MANINHKMVNFKIFPFPARLSLNGVAANWAATFYYASNTL